MGAAGQTTAAQARGLAARTSNSIDLGATQSLPSSLPAAGGSLKAGLSAPGKSVWRLPPVSQQQSQVAQQQAAASGEFYFTSSSAVIPHPAKTASGGEDAHFSNRAAVGVADGVGGWSQYGIDAGEYARQLMSGAKEAVEVHGLLDPLVVLWHAYRAATSLGSSTCLIITLDKQTGMMHTANLGDSGFRIIRKSSIFYRCKCGQHYFNCPYQLGSHSSDLPTDSVRHSVAVQEGDLIVSGSDGLFDNLFDADILAVLNSCSPDNIAEGARLLAQQTRKAAGDSMRQGPFATEAIASGIQFQGGKFDDITVVLTRVNVDTSSSTSSATTTGCPPTRGMASGGGVAASKFLQERNAAAAAAAEEKKAQTDEKKGLAALSLEDHTDGA